jgi:hypothetical protein
MVKVSPTAARSTIEVVPRGLRIVIPVRRHLFTILFLGFWLLGWAFGEVTAAAALVCHGAGVDCGPFQPTGPEGGASLFLLIWLLAWTVGGVAALAAWLWVAFGREIVTVTDRAVTVRRDVLGRGRGREHDMAHVRGLRVSAAPFNPWDPGGALRMWGMGGAGTIAFDYGARTVRFGGGLDEAEARQIVARVMGQFDIPADGPEGGP